MNDRQQEKTKELLDTLKRITSVTALLGLLFWSFGGFDWLAAWVFIGLSALTKLTFGTYLAEHDPELLQRRSRMQKGTKTWDKVWLAFFVPLFFLILVVAGLDAGRYHWSPAPLWAMVLGGGVYIASMGFTFSAMLANTHFEGTVRIQTDRNHRVIDTGPYAHIRHPGYAGLILSMLSLPLLLGSYVAMIPATAVAVLFLVRTALEDRTLKQELQGYGSYVRTVRYRLLPGFW